MTSTSNESLSFGAAYVITEEGAKPEPSNFKMQNGIFVPSTLEPKKFPIGFIHEKETG